MTQPEFQAVVDLAAAGEDQIVSAAAIRNVFAATNLRGCQVSIDGDEVTIRNLPTRIARERAAARAAEVALAELEA